MSMQREEAIRAMEALESREDELQVQYRDTVARLVDEELGAETCRARIGQLGAQLAELTAKLDAIEGAMEPPETYVGPRQAQAELSAQLEALESTGDALNAEREHSIRRLAEHEQQAQVCREQLARLESQMREVAVRLDLIARDPGAWADARSER